MIKALKLNPEELREVVQEVPFLFSLLYALEGYMAWSVVQF